MRGSTDSLDEVPSTISSSSLMYLMNFQIEKPWKRAMQPEHDEDEEQAGGVEGGHQLAERQQRADAVLADRERHRAERADRRHLHDVADDRRTARARTSR